MKAVSSILYIRYRRLLFINNLLEKHKSRNQIRTAEIA